MSAIFNITYTMCPHIDPLVIRLTRCPDGDKGSGEAGHQPTVVREHEHEGVCNRPECLEEFLKNCEDPKPSVQPAVFHGMIRPVT